MMRRLVIVFDYDDDEASEADVKALFIPDTSAQVTTDVLGEGWMEHMKVTEYQLPWKHHLPGTS